MTLEERLLKSAVQTARDVIDEPVIRIEKQEDEVFKLVTLVQNDCLSASVAAAIAGIKENMVSHHVSMEERRKRISARLNAIDSKTTYEAALQNHHEGTCEWVLQSEQLRSWTSSEPQKGKLLWIHGPPGFGKTFLSAWIIKYLTETMKGPVSHFFCVADNAITRDPYAILRSWLSQLLAQNESVPVVMDAFFATRSSRDQDLTHQELWKLWDDVCGAVQNCTFVVDGFDECDHINSGLRYHTQDPRTDFLRDLNVHLSNSEARVLVVSRDVSDIRAYLSKKLVGESDLEMLEYQITLEDTSSDVALFSNSMIKYRLPKKSEALRSKIASEASERSAGMFLWIKLLENEISPDQNAKQLSRTVLEMPSRISEAYTREVERIAQASSKQKDKAVKILRWVLFAVRPLQVKELAEALMVSDDEELNEYPYDALPDEWADSFVDEDYVNGMILGNCGSLLELSSTSNSDTLADRTIHFVHFSVKEYLYSLAPTDPLAVALGVAKAEDEEIRLSRICLRYLTLDVFREMPAETKIYPFLSYASWAWYFHSYLKTSSLSLDISSWTQRAFDPTYSSWRVWTPGIEAKLLEQENKNNNVDSSPESATDKTIDEPSDDMESIDGLNATPTDTISPPASAEPQWAIVLNPTYYACLLGLTEVLQWLEEQGLDCCCAGGRFGFPLQAAIVRNQVDVVTHLLNRHINISQKGGEYGSALAAAAAVAGMEVVDILLDKGADVNLSDSRGLTPIHYASKRGSKAIVEKLLLRSANIDAVTEDGWTALNIACQYANSEAASFLVAEGADFNLTNSDGETPLHLAITHELDDVASSLLEVGSSVDSATNAGWTPLILAVAYERPRIVKQLIKLNADINRLFTNDWTILHEAAQVTVPEILENLLEAGARATALDNFCSTPLHVAVLKENMTTTKILLEHASRTDEETCGSLTVGFVAVEVGNLPILELLLDRGILINNINEHSQKTLFDLARDNEHDDVAKFLVQQRCFQMRVATDATTKLVRHSLVPDEVNEDLVSIVFRNDLEAVQSFLKGSKAGSLHKNDIGASLCLAAACGFGDILTLLLSSGAPVNAKDVNNRTALHHALNNKHENIATLLVTRGASLTIEDDIGSTPLDLAIVQGMSNLNFIKQFIGDWTMSIKKRPSLLEYTRDHNTMSVSQSARQILSGSWGGHYEYLSWFRDRQDEFSVSIPPPKKSSPENAESNENLNSGAYDFTFSNEDNEDQIGSFQYHGFVDEKGVVWFAKLYQKHGWLYRGQLMEVVNDQSVAQGNTKQILRGTWGGNRRLWFGTFQLEKARPEAEGEKMDISVDGGKSDETILEIRQKNGEKSI